VLFTKLCPFSLPAFVQVNPELAGLGLLFSMCVPSTSHTRILHRELGREVTASVKGKPVWGMAGAQPQG